MSKSAELKARKAAALLAATTTNQADFVRAGHKKPDLFLDVGVDRVAGSPRSTA